MLFITRLDLDVRGKAEAGNPSNLHSRVLSMFSKSKDPAASRRVLFQATSTDLLIQSQEEPDPSNLPRLFFHRSTTRMVDPAFAVGDGFQFSLVVNPTKADVSSDRSRGVVAIESTGDQIDWLRRKGEDGGFTVQSVFSQSVDRVKCRHRNHSFTIVLVRFEGRLNVTDQERFSMVVRSGVGRSKTFGCGLLVLDGIHSPVRNETICPWVLSRLALERYREFVNPALSDESAKHQPASIVNELLASQHSGALSPERLDADILQYRYRCGVGIRLIVAELGPSQKELVTILPPSGGAYGGTA